MKSSYTNCFLFTKSEKKLISFRLDSLTYIHIYLDEGQNVETRNVYGSLHPAIEGVLFSPEETASLVRSFFLCRRTLNCLPFSWCAPRWSSSSRLDFVGFFDILTIRHTRRKRGTGSCECHTCCQRIPRQIDFRPRRAPRPCTHHLFSYLLPL